MVNMLIAFLIELEEVDQTAGIELSTFPIYLAICISETRRINIENIP